MGRGSRRIWILANRVGEASVRHCILLTAILISPVALAPALRADDAHPTQHVRRELEGWTIRVDQRLLEAPNEEVGKRALRFLENKLADIKVVVPKDRLAKLQAVTIV